MIVTSVISFVLGFLAAGIFNTISYDKGYKDGVFEERKRRVE